MAKLMTFEKRSRNNRGFWAWAASLITLAALVTEAFLHPLAGEFFNILTDAGGWCMVLLTGLLPAITHRFLTPFYADPNADPPAKLAALRAWNAAALVAASAIAALMIVPWALCGLIVVFTLGFGLLLPPILFAFGPLIAFIVLLYQWAQLRRWGRNSPTRPQIAPVSLAALAAVFAFVLRPLVIGYHIENAANASPAQREKSLALLRTFGGEYDLRILAHGRRPSYAHFYFSGNFLPNGSSSHDWRKTYFRLTGKPHTSASVPPAALGLFNSNDEVRIEETGGARVGSRIPGLSLVSSGIDAKTAPAEFTARSQWTLIFRNDTNENQEARAEIELPEGAVISDAWLWINGEKRPAAFGGKSQVRAAYQEVAVVQRRDPLLVTATHPRRALVQCFPILPGKTMQIRLQVSHALVREHEFCGDNPTLLYEAPKLVARNFSLPLGDFESLLVDGKPHGVLETVNIESGRATPDGFERRVTPKKPLDLTVAIDSGSALYPALSKDVRDDLGTHLSMLPSGSRVRFIDTRVAGNRPTEWVSPLDADSAFAAFYDRTGFGGGIDPEPALSNLMRKSDRPAAILWIHPPIPVEATTPTTLAATRNANAGAPALVSVLSEPGEDALADALDGDRRVYALSGLSKRSLRRAVESAVVAASAPAPNPDGLVPLGGREPSVDNLWIPAKTSATDFSDRAKLVVASRVLAGYYSGKNLTALSKTAARNRLITPLSGAVVLETMEQYRRHGLDPKTGQATNPASDASMVPEPSEWTVILIGAGFVGVLILRARKRRAA